MALGLYLYSGREIIITVFGCQAMPMAWRNGRVHLVHPCQSKTLFRRKGCDANASLVIKALAIISAQMTGQ